MDANAPSNSPASQFDLTQDQQAILDQADKFGRKELHGYCERMDQEEWWPVDAFPKIGGAGFFSVTIPEEYGGAGLDLVSAGLVAQAFSRWNHALALSYIAHTTICARTTSTATAARHSDASTCRTCVPAARPALLG